MSDSLSKDLKDAIDDVAVSLHKGFKKIKSNQQVKDFTKNTTDAFDSLGKEIEKGIDDLTGTKKSTPKQNNKEDIVENDEKSVTTDESPKKKKK